MTAQATLTFAVRFLLLFDNLVVDDLVLEQLQELVRRVLVEVGLGRNLRLIA